METDRKTRAGGANAVHTYIVHFNKRQANYKPLINKAKDEESYSAFELKICCSIWKKKGDGLIPPKVEYHT
jgi:hypothetical protein